MNDKFDPEKLRPVQYFFEPDPRSFNFSRYDPVLKKVREYNIEYHHDKIFKFELHQGVPEQVRTLFETARNLYLYAWLVYRFYPVAEAHALACLEFALREKIGKEVSLNENYVRGGKKPTLSPLLRYAVDHKLIKNENFTAWNNRGIINSRQRHLMEKLREADERGLDEIIIDDSEATVTEEDLNWDYVGMLHKTLPKIRNDYAHGSTTLHNMVLNSIQIVSEIINQIYINPEKNGSVTP